MYLSVPNKGEIYMCKNVILFSKGDYNLSELIKFICRENKTNLAYCRSLPDLLVANSESMPEIVFHDEESIQFNYNLYKDFKSSKKFHMPYYVVITRNVEKFNFDDDNILILDKNNYANKAAEVIHTVKEKKSEVLTEEAKLNIKKIVSEYLNELGLTTNYLGYGYIKELVIDIVEDKRKLKSFNTKLYPELAMKYNTQVINIERNVRNAINVAIKYCKNRKMYDEIMGYGNIVKNHKVPSNKQFITWLVEKVAC